MKVYPVIHQVHHILKRRRTAVLNFHTSWTNANKHYRGLRDMAAVPTPDGAITSIMAPLVLGTLDIPLSKTGLLFTSELYNSLAELGFDEFLEQYNQLTAEYATEAGDD